MKEAQFWRQRQLRRAPDDLRSFITELPSQKSTHTEDLLAYIGTLLPRFREAHMHYASDGYKKWRMKVMTCQ